MENTHQRQVDLNLKALTFINNLKSKLDPTQQNELEETLGWTEDEFSQFLEGNKELNAIQLSKLSRLYNFSLKAFSEDRVDVDSIDKQIKGEEFHLPERYTKGPLTMSNMIINGALNRVGDFFGEDLKECAMNDLQIGTYTLDNPDKYVSVQAVADFYNFLGSHGLDQTDIEYLGSCCCRDILKSPQMDEFNKIPDDREFLRVFFDFVANQVASHFLFNIVENSENRFILETTENPEVAKHFAPERLGSAMTCVNMLGGFKYSLVHQGIKPVASHPKCIHRGDDVCRFQFEF